MPRKSYNIRTLENIRNNEKENITKEVENQNYNFKKNKISEIILKENIITTQQKTIKKKNMQPQQVRSTNLKQTPIIIIT